MTLDEVMSIIVPAALLKRPESLAFAAIAKKIKRLETSLHGTLSLSDLTALPHFSFFIQTLLSTWPQPACQCLDVVQSLSSSVQLSATESCMTISLLLTCV